jgi:hypothetical protein
MPYGKSNPSKPGEPPVLFPCPPICNPEPAVIGQAILDAAYSDPRWQNIQGVGLRQFAQEIGLTAPVPVPPTPTAVPQTDDL